MKIAHWRRARQAVQALAFVLFTLLALYTLRDVRPLLPPDTLLRLDPLAALAAMISERRWLARFIPALIVVVATLVFGRFWCGWLCPLGTLLDWIPSRHVRGKDQASPRWQGVKYSLLFVILFAALWGNLTLMILDPLTIFVRSLGTLVFPGLAWLVDRAQIILYRVSFMQWSVDVIDKVFRGTLLSYKQAYYGGILLLAAFVGGVLALNLLAKRAWCRFFCPLGGLLGLLSKLSWLKRKVSAACVSCNICARECPMGTIDAQKGYASDSGECTLCLDCAVKCPKAAISFGKDWRLDTGWEYDPSRRRVLGALGISVGGLALLKIGPHSHHPNPYRLRPPGAQEATLLSSCIRCGKCIRVCPTQGLQPSLTQSGLEGLWTPILVPRLGPCDFSCTACGDLCPTGAIPQLPLDEKRKTPIGKAYVNPNLCIPWSGRGECIVCEEMCPVPEKAIVLEERPLRSARGEKRTAQAPVVLHDRCIGCGLCESKCPVKGEAAIRVLVDPMP